MSVTRFVRSDHFERNLPIGATTLAPCRPPDGGSDCIDPLTAASNPFEVVPGAEDVSESDNRISPHMQRIHIAAFTPL